MLDQFSAQDNNYSKSVINHKRNGKEHDISSVYLSNSPPRPTRRVSAIVSAPSTETKQRLSINSKLNRHRRKSDSTSFMTNKNAANFSPFVMDKNIERIQVRTMEKNQTHPEQKLFKPPPDCVPMGRHRKKSYFHDGIHIFDDSSFVENHSSKQNINAYGQGRKNYRDNQSFLFERDIMKHVSSYGESEDSDDNDDYSEPVDKVKENQEYNCFILKDDKMRDSYKLCVDENSSRQWKSDEDIKASCFSVRKHRQSDCNIKYSRQKSETDSASNEFKEHHNTFTRKLSLGNMLRRISARKISTAEPIAEKRISSVLAKLVGGGDGASRRAFGGSYQVDSSSWEFLNKDLEDDIGSKKDSFQYKSKTEHHQLCDTRSKDSVYDSECDSGSSTLHSSNSFNLSHPESELLS